MQGYIFRCERLWLLGLKLKLLVMKPKKVAQTTIGFGDEAADAE